MRSASDAAKINRLMQGIGRLARGPGRVYLVGGASAVTLGWRLATIDADLKLDPELALYRAVGRRHPRDAHAQYNALIRRLVSFEHEIERRRFSALRHGHAAGGSTPTAFE